MKIIVLGGDGFCGWPVSLSLSTSHDVLIIDNFFRRNIDTELSISSLTPIKTLEERLKVWNLNNKNPINFIHLDISKQFNRLKTIISDFKPDAIIHFAEQKSAQYSMISSFHKNVTVTQNAGATINVLNSIVENDKSIHLIHLGTMGVYGYGFIDGIIPEGYLEVIIDSKNKQSKKEILYPSNPGSVYHMSKTIDQVMFQFYNKNDNLKITDLHQGIVWGTQTRETEQDESLINRFDYDGEFGTVLNRFIVQSALEHPLTVYGVGGQKRAFININDTVQCIKIALENPPKSNDRVRILNQVSEVFKVKELAELISNKSNCGINYIDNPRNEAQENELEVENKTFIDLGFKPHKLGDNLINEIESNVSKYIDRVDESKILSKVKWN